jgi:DNA-binding CsgD family transcriptional regulator
MDTFSHNQHQAPTHHIRGIIVVGNSGRIRCAGTQAEEWLRKYFLHRDSETLPLTIKRWLSAEGIRGRSLHMRRNGDQLDIRLVKAEQKGPHCLLLEESRRADHSPAHDGTRLTHRELEVLSWVAQGKENWAIGKILNLSPATVRKHLQHVYSKLGVENRTAAARCLQENSQSSSRA